MREVKAPSRPHLERRVFLAGSNPRHDDWYDSWALPRQMDPKRRTDL